MDIEYSSNDEYSDDEYRLKKCLDVEIPKHFDPNITPTTGIEYLQLVMYEAKQCKSIVTVPIDPKKLKHPTEVINDNYAQEYPKILLPKEWKNEKLEEFGRFQKYIQRMRMKRRPEHNGNGRSYWIARITQKPTFSEAIKLDGYNQLFILETISQELQYVEAGTTISDTTGCWIYTILILLEIPLSPSLYGVLREIAKKCSQIRSKLVADVDSDLQTPLNLFICIIGVYYKQFDLADNYTL